MPQPRVRQEDIARAADVSVSTVSRVLSGAPGISERVRSTVKRVARELGHTETPRPARHHRELRKALLFIGEHSSAAATGTIYSLVIGGLQEAAAEEGLAIRYTLRDGDGFLPGHLLDDEQDFGVIILGVDPDPEVLRDLSERGIPTVLTNGLDPDMQADSVSPANFFGGRLAARYLVEQGHTDILALISRHRWTLRRRTDGFLSGIAEFGGGEVNVETIDLESLNASAVFSVMERRRVEGRAPPGAMFCGNDLVAIAAIQALRSGGVAVPDRVSVMGFDDLPVANMTDPALTTIHIDWHRIGREAIRLLMQRAAEPERPPVQIQAGAHLVVRASTQKITKIGK